MTSRWDVEQAVRRSELEPPGRLLMFALLTWSDNDTAIIPEKFTPSLTTLQKATGLARSTVADWLDRLETAGWVVRVRPDLAVAQAHKVRTRYALQVATGPLSGLAKPPKAKELAALLPSPGDGLEASPPSGPVGPGDGLADAEEPDSAGPPHGPEDEEVVRDPDQSWSATRTGSGPPGGHKTLFSDPPIGGVAGAVPQQLVTRHKYMEGPNGYCVGCRRPESMHTQTRELKGTGT